MVGLDKARLASMMPMRATGGPWPRLKEHHMAEAIIRVSKVGCCGGRPSAEVFVGPKVSTDDVNKLVQVNVTRNKALLKKLGLVACGGCISGFDIWIRQHYDVDMRVAIG